MLSKNICIMNMLVWIDAPIEEISAIRNLPKSDSCTPWVSANSRKKQYEESQIAKKDKDMLKAEVRRWERTTRKGLTINVSEFK